MFKLFEKFSEESDGGLETNAIIRSLKIRKWILLVSVIYYLTRTEKFIIKNIELPYFDIIFPSKSDILFFSKIMFVYLTILYVINIYTFIGIDYQEKLNKLREHWLSSFINRNTDAIYIEWRDKLLSVIELLNQQQPEPIVDEYAAERIQKGIEKEIKKMFPPINKYSAKAFASSAIIDFIRFGSVFIVIIYAIFGP